MTMKCFIECNECGAQYILTASLVGNGHYRRRILERDGWLETRFPRPGKKSNAKHTCPICSETTPPPKGQQDRADEIFSQLRSSLVTLEKAVCSFKEEFVADHLVAPEAPR
jgi:hypothetical protein